MVQISKKSILYFVCVILNSTPGDPLKDSIYNFFHMKYNTFTIPIYNL